MAITVADAMRIGGLTRCKVAAGIRGLGRHIRHITVMEVPDVIQWLKGDDLLLTSLFSIKDDPRAVAELVNQLHQKGSAALAIKTNHYVEKIPESILIEGDRLDFPIIEVMNEISYLDIMTPLMNHIFVNSINERGDLESFFKWLTELAMAGKGIESILAAIEKFTGNRITVESEMANSGQEETDQGMEPLTQAQKRELQVSRRSIKIDRVWKQQTISCLLTPIMLNNVIYGYVTYWHTQNDFHETDFMILERSIPLMALEFLKIKTMLDVDQNYKDEFLLDILNGNVDDRYKMEQKANRFGWDLTKDFQVLVIRIDGPEVKSDETAEEALHYQELLRKVMNQMKLFFSFQSHKVILGSVRNFIVVLYDAANFKPEADTNEQAVIIGQSLQLDLSSHFETEFSVGIGRMYPGINGISKGYKEAADAIQLGGMLFDHNFCCHFNDLRLYRILTQFNDKEELTHIYDETIGKLIHHDQEHQTNLTETLRTYFACNASLVETAGQLFVHVNTMKYRLQRIEQITKCSINNSEERLWLQVGLKIQDILFRSLQTQINRNKLK